MSSLKDFEIVDGRLKKYKGNDTVVEIPDIVTVIDKLAFYMCTSIEEIKLPNSVREIGFGAFKSCKSLKKINIPRSVEVIADNAFAFCRSLSSVAIPSSVKTMGEGVFCFCPVITINCEATKKPSGWLSNWKLAKNDGDTPQNHRVVWGYTIPANNEDDFEIENGVLKKYNGSATDIKIPDGVTKIADQAFLKCEFLKSVIIPAGVVKIGDQAFRFCHALKSVQIPNSVTIIGDLAFSSCHELASIEIPNGTLTIGVSAFSYCSALASITIPNSVAKIDSYAFRGCKSLTSVTIPSSVLKMGYRVFEECDSVVLKCEISKKPEGWDTGWKGVVRPVSWGNVAPKESAGEKSSLEIVDGVLKKYRGTGAVVQIPSGVAEVGEYAFSGNKTVEKIIIPQSVKTIGARAFWGCRALKSISIPSGVTSVGVSAFYGCESLLQITIPNSVVAMGDSVFFKCPSLKIVCEAGKKPEGWSKSWNTDKRPVTWKNIPVKDSAPRAEIKKNNDIAVDPKKDVKRVEEKKVITQPPEQTNSSDFKIRNGVLTKYLGAEEIITIPEGVKSISTFAFTENYKLRGIVKQIILPKSLEIIEDGAFADLELMEKIIIPKGVGVIGRVAFRGCKSLTIYCEISTPPSAWDTRKYSLWSAERPVVWGYKTSKE